MNSALVTETVACVGFACKATSVVDPGRNARAGQANWSGTLDSGIAARKVFATDFTLTVNANRTKTPTGTLNWFATRDDANRHRGDNDQQDQN